MGLALQSSQTCLNRSLGFHLTAGGGEGTTYGNAKGIVEVERLHQQPLLTQDGGEPIFLFLKFHTKGQHQQLLLSPRSIAISDCYLVDISLGRPKIQGSLCGNGHLYSMHHKVVHITHDVHKDKIRQHTENTNLRGLNPMVPHHLNVMP